MLIEMLVAILISAVVLGAVVSIITVTTRDNRYETYRDDAIDQARQLIDRLSRELRSAASPTAATAGLLEKATSFDLVFQTVAAGPAGGSNLVNQERVRYCLDSSLTLWRQSETWTTSTAPAMPDTSACPSSNSAWGATYKELNDVTNEIGGDTTRPLFSFGPTGYTNAAQINQVSIDLYTDENPGGRPGPTELTSGIYLRNETSSPTATFTTTLTPAGPSTRYVNLNGSGSYDPQGQQLSYQWYTAGTCSGGAISGGTPILGATTQSYTTTTAYTTGTNQTFLLQVTDTAGLVACQTQTISISP